MTSTHVVRVARLIAAALAAAALMIAALMAAIPSAALWAFAEQDATSKAAPVEPTAAILDAFRSHSLVALTDPHGDERMHELLVALVRHPEFAARVNDIVVEPGSARYQPLMDRYIAGEAVDANALRDAWRNSTQHQILDHPLFEEFVRAVREVNARLPASRRLRVLLGDPPIDWDAVKGPADHREWILMREWFPAAVIQTEVLGRRRRALVVYGQMHLQRKQIVANYDMDAWQAQTLVSAVERATGVRVFNIWTVGGEDVPPELAALSKPGLLMLRGSTPGAADFERFRNPPQRFKVVNGSFASIPKEQWRTLRMEEQFEAILSFGPQPTSPRRRPAPAVCADTAYLEMRMRRLTLTAAPPPLIEQFRGYCTATR